MIKKISKSEIKELAVLHQQVLPSFLSVFPLSFIEKFYTSQLARDGQLILGYFNEEKLVGFVFGTNNVEELYKDFINKNKFYFYIQTVLSLMKKPKYILLFASKLFSKSFISVCKRQLVYIGVSKSAKQKGIGSILINALEKEWSKYNYYELEVESENKAHLFYIKHGFLLVHEYNNWVEKKILMGKRIGQNL